MKGLNYILTVFILFAIISCAKQSTPMGGPKDETPPKLLSMNPKNQSTNTRPNTIELEFDEYVKVEQPNKQLLITPRINKDEMTVIANKNRVFIKLNQDLEDSTTYVFNFQKTVKDITEGNVPPNLKLVFSTGPSIDSLSFKGKVSYLFPQKDKEIKDVLVGLYEITDTLNVLTGQPYYLSQTDSLGNFSIENIKAGNYKAYAWFDSNGSLKAEDKLEPYAFLSDPISIEENVEQIQFFLSKADLTPFRINRAAAVSGNFDLVLNKTPIEVKVEHDELNSKLFTRLDDKTLRFYHTEIKNDSTQVRLLLQDSVGFRIDTTVYAKFLESDRSREKLEYTIGNKRNFLDKLQAEISFNKPVKELYLDSAFVRYDSAGIIRLERQMFSLPDSSNRTKLLLTLPTGPEIAADNFKLFLADSTFLDIENQFNEKKSEIEFKRLKKENLVDEINVSVNSEEGPFLIHILDRRDEIIAEKRIDIGQTAKFTNIEPGTVKIRAILDSNKNGRWDTSNMNENRQAERVYYLQGPDGSIEILIRAGWVLEFPIEPKNLPGITAKSEQ